MVAAVGADGGPLLRLLDEAGIDRRAVAQLPGVTYRWRAEHHPARATPVEEEQRLGVYLDWRPQLTAAARSSPILFLGSMHPQRQLEVLQGCPGVQLVALDTMRDFISSNRAELEQLLRRTDLLLANEAELRALLPSARSDPLVIAREALERWQLKWVVLKRGAAGSAVVSSSSTREFAAAVGPAVVDPTGAGDALAGGLLGRLAQLGSAAAEAIDQAMADGSAAAGRAISRFGAQGLIGSGS